MQDMAQYGRNGDTMMAHVAPGEMMVPPQILEANPNLATGLGMAFQDAGADPTRYIVGSGTNSMNPMTGQPEFFLGGLGNVVGSVLKSPFVQNVAGNLLLQKLVTGSVDPKMAFLSAGLGSLTGGGGLGNLFGGGQDVEQDPLSKALSAVANDNQSAAESAMGRSTASGGKTAPASSGYKEGLLGIGQMLGLDAESGLGKIFNTQAGEALAVGLGAKLYDMLFPAEEPDEDPYGMLKRFNRGAGQAPVTLPDRRQMRVERRAEGGPMYFPRRDGGIMPEEGSGTKDDVPAMLTAGEFVMTRDAVKGAGGGSLKRGIKRMDGLMNHFEEKSNG